MGEKTTTEHRYYLCSLVDLTRFADATRGHWGTESAPQAHGKEVQDELTDCAKAAREMKVGPSESASRSRLQTTPSRCGQEPSVVSIGVKALGTYPEQVWVREANASEPSWTRRKPKTCRRNQGRLYLLGQSLPETWRAGRAATGV
jgi:hypothetical protein